MDSGRALSAAAKRRRLPERGHERRLASEFNLASNLFNLVFTEMVKTLRAEFLQFTGPRLAPGPQFSQQEVTRWLTEGTLTLLCCRS